MDTSLRAAIRRLKPPASAPSAEAVSYPDDVRYATMVIGDDAVRWVVGEALLGVNLVMAEESERIDLPLMAIQASSEAILLEVLLRLSGHDWAPDADRSYRRIAASATEQDVPFTVIVSLMRTVQQLWLAELLSCLTPLGDDSSVARIVGVVSSAVDTAVTVVVRDYIAEQSMRAETTATHQREAVIALLSGEHVETADADLGIKLDHHHVGIVLWREGGATGSRLRPVANQLRGLLPGATLLTVSDGAGRLWVWLSRAVAPSQREADGLTTFAPNLAGVKVAMGPAAKGRHGFRRTHLLARDTASSMDSTPGHGEVRCWQDAGLTTLINQDTERIAWFVEGALGPLAGDDPTSDEHRRTLLMYVNSGDSLIRTAAKQHVHRNTVVYRLRRIEELLPMPLGENRLRIHAALDLAFRFGPAVLTPRVSL